TVGGDRTSVHRRLLPVFEFADSATVGRHVRERPRGRSCLPQRQQRSNGVDESPWEKAVVATSVQHRLLSRNASALRFSQSIRFTLGLRLFASSGAKRRYDLRSDYPWSDR